jgi:aromatic-amino-acid transaminase
MTHSHFSEIPLAPADPILGVTEAFKADASPTKVNLGVGIYQDAGGKMPILDTVKQATAKLIATEDTKAYTPVEGVLAYIAAVQELLFGKDSALLKDKRVATVQTVGGSGGLKLGFDLLKRFFPNSTVYLSDPSWENHRQIIEGAGFVAEQYPYYDPATNGLKSAEMLETLASLPARSIVLLHACCHNPTGVDLDANTWREVATICAERDLIPFVDFAYQGFGDGLEEDAFAIRLLAERGLTFVVANSFSKSFALYRERVGAVSVVTGSAKEAASVLSQLRRCLRCVHSSPPSFGASVVALGLTSPELRPLWERELTEMRTRIHEMRTAFSDTLARTVKGHDFSFILKQKGMFSYSGLSEKQIQALREHFHIYALSSGRICVAAMNHSNLEYICDSIAKVLSTHNA